MTENHARNDSGTFFHLCLAFCRREEPRRILGWCGLDGKENAQRPEIFVLLHKDARGMGYGTQCAAALLDHAFRRPGLPQVHGGCDKTNIPSARMMQKAGMTQYTRAENGDPLFIADRDSYTPA